MGTRFKEGGACQTAENSRGAVRFVDDVLVRLNERTQIEFKAPARNGKEAPIRIGAGSVYFFSREPRRFPQIDTPVVSAAVRGTEFVVEVTPNQTVISVLEGSLECSNEHGRLMIGAGEQALTVLGAAPVKRIMVRPWDAVQWALYYPAVLDAAELSLLGFPDEASRLATQQSVAAYTQGDVTRAFELLDQLPGPKPMTVALFQSALYLAVGQVRKAEVLLAAQESLIAGAPAQVRSGLLAVSRSQLAVIAVINNRREEAFSLAREAVEASATSTAAALAMSYVEQMRTNLKEAKLWAERALEMQPGSAAARARLAELQLGFGELGEAVRTVERGLAITRDDSRLLTVSGFAYLMRYQTARAIGLFDQAMALDPAAGLPHLGKGLALIRGNRLPEGRRELETAVHLEPTDSLMRSYLGKAFFEEKRDNLAGIEYELARQFDPLDPTPYLYSAFLKLGNYRPVEALWDIEDSIRLNGNRAVYRSRLLLDQDQAVRSVGLSQVFNQVGFTEAGRIEAVKSINSDYGNFSAHLLLSGSYFDRPQLNKAVISEQLLTRLLAPVNINSVRGEASFNEYTSLFDRQRMQVFVLSEGRSADEFIQAAPRITLATDRFAAGVVYGARYQGGYRANDQSTLFAPGLLMQFQVTPVDILSIETIQFRADEGDNSIQFDPWLNDPDFSRSLESFTQRVGWHHQLGPGSHLIGQVLYLRRDLKLDDKNEPTPLAVIFPGATQDQTQHLKTEGWRAEIQHIWDTRWVSLVVGGSFLDAEDRKQESTTFSPFGGFTVSSQGVTPADSQRAYLYSTWHLGPKLDVTAGGSYGSIRFAEVSAPPYDNASRSLDALNPKVGWVARLTSATTLRGAYYETLGGSGAADLESLEPTQIAGFNQLFDDPVATEARGAGVGLDHKIAKYTYAGVEATWRDLRWPYGLDQQPAAGGVTPNNTFLLGSRERGLRGYGYQVLSRTTTATVDYTLIERQEDTAQLGDPSPDTSLTHRVRLGINYFNPGGWFGSVGATWRYQTLESFEPVADGVLNGSRDFWILDATVGRQFPRRAGYVAVSFNNLLDSSFLYQPVGIDQRFLPTFSVNMRLSLNFN